MNLSAAVFIVTIILCAANSAFSIRFPDRIPDSVDGGSDQPLKTAVFALGSFWWSEAAFGCLDGVVRTAAVYAGGSKPNPEYRSLGDHAESVQVPRGDWMGKSFILADESCPSAKFRQKYDAIKGCCIYGLQIEYDPRIISFRQLLDIFWTSHDSRQVFGQGPDVGNQYRSIIFTNGTEESRYAALSKEKEQTRSKNSVVATQIQQLGLFYPAEPEHQKFELKRNPFLLQLIGNLAEEELERSSLATKLNGYAAELCPTRMQKQIDAKINDIVRKGWPILREI